MADTPAPAEFKLTVDGEELHFDGKLRAREAMDLEATTGMTVQQWSDGLQNGSVTSMVALVYLLKKRTNPTIKFSQIDFDLDTLEMEEPEVAPEVPTEAGDAA